MAFDLVEELFGTRGVGPRDRRAVGLVEGIDDQTISALRGEAGTIAQSWDAPFDSYSRKGALIFAVGLSGGTMPPHEWLRTFGDAVRAAVVSSFRARPWIAVGGMSTGAAGIRASYREAKRTLEIARQMWDQPRVVLIDDFAGHLAVASDPLLRGRLMSYLSPLLSRSGVPILDALEAFYQEGTVEGAAERLGVHRHTVARRLEVAARELGRNVRGGNDRLILEMATIARRLQSATRRVR